MSDQHKLDALEPVGGSSWTTRYSAEDLAAIERARARGITWKQIGAAFYPNQKPDASSAIRLYKILKARYAEASK